MWNECEALVWGVSVRVSVGSECEGLVCGMSVKG